MAHHTPSSSRSKHRKAQFFIISAFAIVTILYFISRWMEPFTIPDTSIIVWNDEPFILNNVIEKIKDTVKNSKDIEELNYSLQEFEYFVKEYGIIRDLDIDLNINITNLTVAQEGRPVDVMLIMDRSGSMDDDCPGGQADPGETPCKINDAKEAAKIFVDLLNSLASSSLTDRSGLVSFSATATLDQQLTNNKGLVKNAIDAMVTSTTTAIGSGINLANTELTSGGRARPPTIWAEVLLSDGIENQGSDPLGKAKIADANGIIIYTIGLGSDANETLLKDIANITDGKYYFAPSGAELEDIYREVAKEILSPGGIVYYCANITSPHFKLGTCRNETFI